MFSRLRGPSSVFETPIYSLSHSFTLVHIFLPRCNPWIILRSFPSSWFPFLFRSPTRSMQLQTRDQCNSRREINATPDEDAPAICEDVLAIATEIGALDEDAIEDAHDDPREEETVLDAARINAIPDEDSRDEDAIPDPDISAENNATPGEDAPAISTEIDALGEDALEDAHDEPKEEELVLEGEDDLPAEGIGIRKRDDYKYIKKKKKKRGFRDGDGSVAGEGAEDANISFHLGPLASVSSSQFAAIDTPGNNSSSGSSTRSDATSPTL